MPVSGLFESGTLHASVRRVLRKSIYVVIAAGLLSTAGYLYWRNSNERERYREAHKPENLGTAALLDGGLVARAWQSDNDGLFGYLDVLDTQTGKVLWERHEDRYVHRMFDGNGSLIVVTFDREAETSTIESVSISNGNIVWSLPLKGRVDRQHRLSSELVATTNGLFLALQRETGGTTLYGIDPHTGKICTSLAGYAAPYMRAGMIYSGGDSFTVHGCNLSRVGSRFRKHFYVLTNNAWHAVPFWELGGGTEQQWVVRDIDTEGEFSYTNPARTVPITLESDWGGTTSKVLSGDDLIVSEHLHNPNRPPTWIYRTKRIDRWGNVVWQSDTPATHAIRSDLVPVWGKRAMIYGMNKDFSKDPKTGEGVTVPARVGMIDVTDGSKIWQSRIKRGLEYNNATIPSCRSVHERILCGWHTDNRHGEVLVVMFSAETGELMCATKAPGSTFDFLQFDGRYVLSGKREDTTLVDLENGERIFGHPMAEPNLKYFRSIFTDDVPLHDKNCFGESS